MFSMSSSKVAAVEVEREVVAGAAQPPCQADVVGKTRQAARAGDVDHGVEIGRVTDDGGRGGFDQVVESRVGEMAPQGVDGRRREHDIADQTQAHQQDLQGSTVASSSSITGMSSLIG